MYMKVPKGETTPSSLFGFVEENEEEDDKDEEVLGNLYFLLRSDKMEVSLLNTLY
jgi:hypothetical protein